MNPTDSMRRAVELAWRGIGYTLSNPMVGCLLVKSGKVIGEGWHQQFGNAHAEVNAIENAEKNGYSVSGAHMFVTLEPCHHHGKTPPCVDLIIKKRIASVSVLFPDPNPHTAGQSITKLRTHGIDVPEDFAELRNKHADLNEDFFFSVTHQIPFIAIKMAMDANGHIAQRGKQIAITSELSQNHTHFLRQRYDTILVGKNTVQIDNPHLGVRYGDFWQGKRDPLRIVFDPHLTLNSKFQVFRDEHFLLITRHENEQRAQKIFGNRILSVPAKKDNRFDLVYFQKQVYQRGVASILVEGGAHTARQFIEEKCVQKAYFFTSPEPKVIKNPVKGIDWKSIPEFHLQRKKRLGPDTLHEGKFLFS